MCDGTLVRQLQNEVQLLRKHIESLENRLKAYENAHTPPSRSYKRRPLKPEDERKSPGRKPGHEGTTRPYREPDKTIPVTQDTCTHCNATLGEPRSFESRIIEDIPRPQQATITRFLVARYLCERCGRETVATHPDLPASGLFGKNLLSLAAAMKYKYRLPYRKITHALKAQHGIDITPAAVVAMVGRTAVSLRDGYSGIGKRIMNAAVVHADETSIRVDGKKWWIWIFVAGDDVLVVVADSRGEGVIKSVLGPDFTGIVVCDGWKPYKAFTSNLQRCWAHLLREADGLAEKGTEGRALAHALHEMFDRATDVLEANPPPQERRRLWRRMRRWMGIWLNKPSPEAQVQKFINKVRNGYDHWFTFVLHPGVEPTNNTAERALRESVVQRKIIGCLRNQKGTFAHETMMSVFATWENQGLNIYDEMGKYL